MAGIGIVKGEQGQTTSANSARACNLALFVMFDDAKEVY